MPPSVVLLNSSWRSSTNHFIPWILSRIVLWLAVCILPALIKRFSSVALIFKLLISHWLASSAHSSDYLPFNTIVLSFTYSSFNHHFFLFSLGDLNTACFSFSSPLYCPQLLKFLRSVEKYWCHFCQDFANSIDALFVWQSFFVRESTLIFQRSCLFQSLIVEMKSERCQFFFLSIFEIQVSLVKGPTYVIQYM
jgi:hypothetical protein